MNEDKPIVWLHGEIKTPPFSLEGRIEAGTLLRGLQGGERIGLRTVDRCRRSGSDAMSYALQMKT